eukprot:CAMPEP_0185691694 /NCGR_PEP_ID=MMETSP1164-20130828/2011_1 /TAXON_ID=1104430 /ORGANISM="Chrysoreinhardia sp, Strain CCMP2950" /LENGTH=75 /DNA_ID=CAMNT_0028358377 /DNA_START=1 /DNA_END=225 /DNA_ORIENTATION=-
MVIDCPQGTNGLLRVPLHRAQAFDVLLSLPRDTSFDLTLDLDATKHHDPLFRGLDSDSIVLNHVTVDTLTSPSEP